MNENLLSAYNVYLNEVVEHWRKHRTLKGFSEITKKHKVKGITKEIFFMFGLDKEISVSREKSDRIRLLISKIDAERKLKSKQAHEECRPSEEPLNNYIPIKTLYPYLLRDYRAEQKKVTELTRELLETQQKKNKQIEELKDKLSLFEQFDINAFRQLQKDYKEVCEEANKYKSVILRLQGILNGEKLNKFIQTTELSNKTKPLDI